MTSVRVFTTDTNVNLSDPIPLPLSNFVHQVKFTRFFKESRVGLYICKHESTATIDITNKT
jgi:hypothetical protein